MFATVCILTREHGDGKNNRAHKAINQLRLNRERSTMGHDFRSARYWDLRSRLYQLHLRTPIIGSITRKEHKTTASLLQRFAPFSDSASILSLGCGILETEGTGESSSTIYLDISMEMLLANRLLNDRDTYIRGDALALPFCDDSFHLVIAEGLSELLPDAGTWFKELHRVLKDDGVVIFTSAPGHLLNRFRILFNPFITFRTAAYWVVLGDKLGFTPLARECVLLQDIFAFRKSGN